MATRRPLFILTAHCKSNSHCTTCRTKNGGRHWRTSLEKFYELPMNSVDFDCPYGKKWIEDSISNGEPVKVEEKTAEVKTNPYVQLSREKRNEVPVPVNFSQKRGCGCSRG